MVEPWPRNFPEGTTIEEIVLLAKIAGAQRRLRQIREQKAKHDRERKVP